MVAKKASDHCDVDIFAPCNSVLYTIDCFKVFSFTVLSIEKSLIDCFS